MDTHCHIQFDDYNLNPTKVINEAHAAGVTRLICVGCTPEDSHRAVEFAAEHPSISAAIGIHPHYAKSYVVDKTIRRQFSELAKNGVAAIGECGLDYYYKHSPASEQKKLFRWQLELASEYDLPLIFHVREAFDDFLAILSDFEGVRGVVHSFTANLSTLDKILSKGLYIGLNGIMTFTKDADQLAMAKRVPLESLVLETDAPFLTPVPFRGTICQPKHVRVTAEFLSTLRGQPLDELAAATTHNARKLFNLK